MMVGVDQHVYSDYALQWLLEEYADDGDEIICVHVTDKDARTIDEKTYKTKAQTMVGRIRSKIPDHCAISIKLEYAVGKLHQTFQKLVGCDGPPRPRLLSSPNPLGRPIQIQ